MCTPSVRSVVVISHHIITPSYREILTWSHDQIKSVWSHTHKDVFFNNKEEIDKKND